MGDDLLRRQLAEIFAADQAGSEREPENAPIAAGLPREVTLRPLSFDMVEAFLDDHELRHLRDVDGEFVVRFTGGDHRLGAIEIGMDIQGSDGSVLDLRASFDARLGRKQFGPALILCNDWNRRFRIPKATFLSEDDIGIIVLRQSIMFSLGTFPEQVADDLDFFFSMTQDFYEWALEEERGVF